MGALPPVARLAVAFAAGVALAALPGRPAIPALLLLVPLLPLIRASRRPVGRTAWVLPLVILAGLMSALAASRQNRCGGLSTRDGAHVVVVGAFVSAPSGTHAAPFRVLDRECPSEVRATAPEAVRAGRALRLEGTWREGRGGGVLLTRRVSREPGARMPASMALARWQGALNRRIEVLYGDRAPLVAALTLARRQGLDPGLREAFARSGLAHLLAISGFHVGVITVLVGILLRRLGLRRRSAGLAASLAAWIYVGFLGFPDAACRAAVILAALAVSRARGRPPARWGALGAALLVLLALDPRRLASPGFQLSFAGAAGLTAWAGPLRERLVSGWLRRVPGVAMAVAAGVAATAGTLPVVAWHFERVSLVGIPATLVVGPLVALALPGALASLAVDAVLPAAGRFLAGGVDLLLAVAEHAVRLFAAPAWASVWVPRSWVVVGAAGAVVATLAVRRTRVRRTPRRLVAMLGGVAALTAWPLLLALQSHGTVEIVAVDVGQGDAIAVRSPAGRWILVDAGPPWEGDAAGTPVVRALRRRGVHRLELLVLTHPDLDHVGGAAAVLATLDVGAVLEPSRPTGKESYVALLQEAGARGVPWIRAAAGQHFELDGMALDVLHPDTASPGGPHEGTVANAESVVLGVRYGDFDALLTGDAPTDVERAVLDRVSPSLEVLKVGHHGSATSTDSLLLARAHPRVALVSVGRGNRYGHPSPSVLARLRRFAVEIHRTDREGTLSVQGRRDGSFQVREDRPGHAGSR